MAAKSRSGTAKRGADEADERFRREAGARLAQLLDLYDSRAAASAIGRTSVDTLAEWVAGRSRFSLEVLARLAEPKDVSLDWLATGTGSMRRGRSEFMARALGVIPSAEDPERAYRTAEQETGYFLIPVFRVVASSGHGAFATPEEPMEPMAFPRGLLRRLKSSSVESLSVVFNRGESNEPDIMDGDAMLVDRGIERIADDAFYVFARDEALFVKLIERMIDGRVALRARNPNYREEILLPDDAAALTVFGRVIWRGGLV